MTDKEKIRAEIKRQLFFNNKPYAVTRAEVLNGLLSFIDSMKEEPVIKVWHDAEEAPEMYRKYLARYSDGRINGSWERHDDGFIPWKDVVKEHNIIQWCYVEDLLKIM